MDRHLLRRWFSSKMSRIRRTAVARHRPFTITPDFLTDLYFRQRGACATSGAALLVTSDSNDPASLTIARRDEREGWEPGNVVLVTAGVSRARERRSDGPGAAYSTSLYVRPGALTDVIEEQV